MATDTPEILAVAHLTARVAELETAHTQLRLENRLLTLKLAHLRQQLWGRKSEHLPRDPAQQIFFTLDDDVTPPLPTRETATPRTPKTGLPKGPKPLNAQLRRDVIAVPDPAAAERVCPLTGQPMLAGWEDVLEVLARKPAEYYVKRYTRTVFVSPTGAVAPVYTPWPVAVLPRSRMHASVVAHIATAHYADHQPYYRIATQLTRQGIHLPRHSQAALMAQLDRFVEPLVTCLQNAVLTSGYVQLDATPVALLDRARPGRAREGTLWSYRSVPTGPPDGRSPPYVWFTYSHSKSPDHPRQVLTAAGYTGVLQTDGAPGLDETLHIPRPTTLAIPTAITHAGCWAHARRYFVDAYRVGDASARPYLTAISRLFQIDARATRFGLTIAQQQHLRTRYRVPLLEALWARAAQALPTLPPKSDLAKALHYLLAHRAPLTRCVTTPGVRLDNNLVENSIRPIKLGESNWLFIGAPTAGPRLAHLYTLVENCRLAGIDPEAYLIDVMTRLLDTKANRVHELLPHAWKAAQATPPVPPHLA
jgi:transposase